jgi:hypothetical protein
VTVGWVLAAAEPTSWTDFAQYGVLGLIVLGFIFGKIAPGYLLDRAEARLAEKDALIERMRLAMEEKTVPALIRSTETLATVADLLAQRPAPRSKAQG